jgi:hypothetical protein
MVILNGVGGCLIMKSPLGVTSGIGLGCFITSWCYFFAKFQNE